jgi:hypothetical protein
VPDLHPKLQAALERDGVTLGKLAQVVGLDARTVARWGSEDEYGTRASAFRRLEDVIAGRARVVETELGALVIQQLGDCVAPGDLARVLSDLVEIRRRYSESLDALAVLCGGSQRVTDTYKSFDINASESDASLLTTKGGSVTLPVMLNPEIIQSAAAEMERRHRGKPMVNVSIKLPEGYRERLEASAKAAGMTWAEYLRSLGWMFSTEP